MLRLRKVFKLSKVNKFCSSKPFSTFHYGNEVYHLQAVVENPLKLLPSLYLHRAGSKQVLNVLEVLIPDGFRSMFLCCQTNERLGTNDSINLLVIYRNIVAKGL